MSKLIRKALAFFRQIEPTGVVVEAHSEEDEQSVYVAYFRPDVGVKAAVLVFDCHEDEWIAFSESEAPTYFGASSAVLDHLDDTLDEGSLRWRRDCRLLQVRSDMDEKQPLVSWTAYFSPVPLANLSVPARVGVLVGPLDGPTILMEVTDGIDTQQVRISRDHAANLVPLWNVEWEGDLLGLELAIGYGGARYIPVGSPECRVGMLFNEVGGLLAWSPLAVCSQLLCELAGADDAGFPRKLLLSQQMQWRIRRSMH